MASLFEVSGKINSYYQQPNDLQSIDKTTWDYVITHFKGIIIEVLGLTEEAEAATDNQLLNGTMDVLIELRKHAKFSKDYALSDKIRDDLKAVGVQLKDEKGGEMSYTID